MKSKYNHVDDFVSYLKETLMPDLKADGKDATAADF